MKTLLVRAPLVNPTHASPRGGHYLGASMALDGSAVVDLYSIGRRVVAVSKKGVKTASSKLRGRALCTVAMDSAR